MAECECIAKCPFFHDKMAEMPSMAAMLKKRYCLDKHTTCARWMVRAAIGAPGVPPDLFPNQHDRAEKLISTTRQ